MMRKRIPPMDLMFFVMETRENPKHAMPDLGFVTQRRGATQCGRRDVSARAPARVEGAVSRKLTALTGTRRG
jgi:hypothetical protein